MLAGLVPVARSRERVVTSHATLPGHSTSGRWSTAKSVASIRSFRRVGARCFHGLVHSRAVSCLAVVVACSRREGGRNSLARDTEASRARTHWAPLPAPGRNPSDWQASLNGRGWYPDQPPSRDLTAANRGETADPTCAPSRRSVGPEGSTRSATSSGFSLWHQRGDSRQVQVRFQRSFAVRRLLWCARQTRRSSLRPPGPKAWAIVDPSRRSSVSPASYSPKRVVLLECPSSHLAEAWMRGAELLADDATTSPGPQGAAFPFARRHRFCRGPCQPTEVCWRRGTSSGPVVETMGA